MSFFKGLSCPVCNTLFVETDDIVTCPQCGLPHHRHCWQQTGHCHAEQLHGTDNQWSRSTAQQESACEQATEPPRDETPHNSYNEYKPFNQPQVQNAHYHEGETIDGVSVGDHAVVIGNKTEYYIPRFRRIACGGNGGWNWGAFFFGAYWLIYRKMYLGGFLLLALNLFHTFLSGFVFNAMGITNTQQLYDVLYQMLYVAPTTNPTQLFYLLSIWFLSAIITAINIMIAVFGNKLYYRHCNSVISKARQRVPDLSSPELIGIGGTTIGVVLISGILMSFLEQLISILFL